MPRSGWDQKTCRPLLLISPPLLRQRPYHQRPLSWYVLMNLSMDRSYVFSTSGGKKQAGSSPDRQ
jgi:hypothetical protein